MRVVFLDIDGVLNSVDDYEKFPQNKEKGFPAYDIFDRPLSLLKHLVNETDAVIVLSSAWRVGYMHAKENPSFNEGKNRFNAINNEFSRFGLSVFDVTPQLNGCRGEQIQAWLDNHDDVESFVIFDDDADMAHLIDRLVKTTYQSGLQRIHIDMARKLLED